MDSSYKISIIVNTNLETKPRNTGGEGIQTGIEEQDTAVIKCVTHEPNEYGVVVPTTKYMIHWIDGRYCECRRDLFRIILHVSWVSMKGGLLPW